MLWNHIVIVEKQHLKVWVISVKTEYSSCENQNQNQKSFNVFRRQGNLFVETAEYYKTKP